MSDEIDDRQSYYAAAIMMWAHDKGKEHFLEEDMLSWAEAPWGDPYLDKVGLRSNALQRLCDLQAVLRVPDPYGPTVYELTDVNIIALGEMYPNSPFYKVARYGIEWTVKALQKINSGSQNDLDVVDASILVADGWSALKVELDDELPKAAIAAAEVALKTIEENNGYADSEPDERNSIITTLRGSIESVKAGRPSKNVIIQGILEPLKYIAKKFTDAAMG